MTIAEARALAMRACRACGASQAVATSLVDAALSAQASGRPEVGLAHFLDYLDAFRAGRIDGAAEPDITRPLPALIRVDARRGIAQLGFDRAFEDLVDVTRRFGIAMFAQSDCYTAGEIGYYCRRLAGEGLVSLAFANAHAMVAPAAGIAPVYSTNPLAFGAPLPPPQPPLVFDQSASAAAFVTVARAAAEGSPIPEGWAVDADGHATTDAAAAVKGTLLAFGGARGANIALMVEVLAAGVAGASWSLDAGRFHEGDASPAIGLTVIAVAPEAIAPTFAERLAAQVRRLAAAGVHIPGRNGRLHLAETDPIDIAPDVVAAIASAGR